MNRFRITTVILGLLPAGLAPSLRADAHDKETHVAISQPLQVENILLAPGEYVFKLTQPDNNHSVVSIYNANGNRPEGTVIGCSVYRADANDKKRFTFSQPQGNQPSILKSWFFPGDNFGVEFPAKNLTREAGRAMSSDGGTVKSKGKRQTAGAADDGSSTRN